MGIFRREQGDVQQAGTVPSPETSAQAGHVEQQARPAPSYAPAPEGATAAGVVPPPAAPVYSTRPPEPAARFGSDGGTAVAERVRVARESQPRAQESVRGRLQVDVERTRAAAPGASAARRPAPAPVRAPAPARARHTRPELHTTFDAVRAAQTGLLNLAWSWQQAGAPIRAIHAYMQVLHRYPGTPAADAAVADLVEISDKLAGEGQFHIALAIYDELERLL